VKKWGLGVGERRRERSFSSRDLICDIGLEMMDMKKITQISIEFVQPAIFPGIRSLA
jgi:hypothetical protein